MAYFNPDMSIYIPRVDTRSLPVPKKGGFMFDAAYEASAKEFISEQFKKQMIGDVERVDLTTKVHTTENRKIYKYYIAFVYFKEWYNTPAAHRLQEAIDDPQQKAQFNFDEKFYWIISKNINPRTQNVSKINTNDSIHDMQEIKPKKKIFTSSTKYELRILDVNTGILSECQDDDILPPPTRLIRTDSTY